MSSKSSSMKQDPLKKNSNKTKINQKDSDRVITDDPRFAHVHDDPRFIRPKRRDMKVKIDERFKQMLNTKDFSDTPKVDKYGRNLPSNYAEQELRRFYTLGEKNEKDKPDFTDDVSDPDLSQSTYDRARGEGLVSSSSESEPESESDADDGHIADDQQSQDEAENIPRGAQTHRFACVNLDWDNLKSVDLMKVFSAFKPEGSFIRS
ncbi:9206_t:CDS:2, partial [Paraglomus occultum]